MVPEDIYCHVHKTLLPILILSQMNPIHTPNPISLRSILLSPSRLRSDIPDDLFAFDYPTKILYVLFVSPIHATGPAHNILLTLLSQKYLVTRTMIDIN
jgi:hypothetical protein